MPRRRTVDPLSPVPLYHQIAEAIRARIEAGELAPGATLEPLRQAAETWKVNLHTVRHAYAALARSGLVERSRGPRGTRVSEDLPHGRRSSQALQAFVERVAREADERYGLEPSELAAALRRLRPADAGDLPRLWIVECSRWQCESHARELERHFEVEARPWPLGRRGAPPAGTVISTYFHYNDVRRQWPRRLAGVRFVTIQPDPALRERLAGARQVIVGERDRSTAEAATADLLALFGDAAIEIQPCVEEDPARCLERGRGETPVLYTPRVWAELPQQVRDHPRAIELSYVFDRDELEDLAQALDWQSRQGVMA